MFFKKGIKWNKEYMTRMGFVRAAKEQTSVLIVKALAKLSQNPVFLKAKKFLVQYAMAVEVVNRVMAGNNEDGGNCELCHDKKKNFVFSSKRGDSNHLFFYRG